MSAMAKTLSQTNGREISWFANPEPDHAVHFYPLDDDLLKSLTDYFSVGLKKGETCIAIATPTHLASLNALLRTNGINVSEAITSGQYIMLDAAETLAEFMDNGNPDYQKFLSSVGRIIHLAAGKDKPIRAFGEMVSLLREQGNQVGLIRLEEYWHDLVKEHSFSLYCGYPESLFDDSLSHQEAINDICNCHSLALSY